MKAAKTTKEDANKVYERRIQTWRAELEGKKKAATKVHGAAYALLDEWVEDLSLSALAEERGLSPEDARKAWNMLRDLADKFGERPADE